MGCRNHWSGSPGPAGLSDLFAAVPRKVLTVMTMTVWQDLLVLFLLITTAPLLALICIYGMSVWAHGGLWR